MLNTPIDQCFRLDQFAGVRCRSAAFGKGGRGRGRRRENARVEDAWDVSIPNLHSPWGHLLQPIGLQHTLLGLLDTGWAAASHVGSRDVFEVGGWKSNSESPWSAASLPKPL